MNNRKLRPADSPVLFREEVEKLLHSSYMLPVDTVTKGQALSYLAAELRDQYGANAVSWVLPANKVDLASLLESSGFAVVRGRPLRHTRKGMLKPYAPCQVVVRRERPAVAHQPARAEAV